MKRVVGINQEATNRLLTEALPMLTETAIDFAGQVKVFVTACRSGKASHKESLVRIPAFVFNDKVNFCGKGLVDGGTAFAAYYLAHELAHVKAETGTHNASFMEAFTALCPPELQWYETIYKPKRAAAAGIVRAGD